MTEKSKVEIILDEKEVTHLLNEIYQTYGYDFTDYSRASTNRRLTRFLINNNLSTLELLKIRILNNPDFFAYFVEEMMVNVTEMFRDPTFFKSLREKVFPSLSTYPYIRIWVAGCSTGEELFSLSIVLEEENLLTRSRIYATDINQKALIKAKEGVLPLTEIQLYKKNYLAAGGVKELSHYYSEERDSVVFNPNLLKHIVFYPHNLVSDTSFNEFHLIICRNVFIYFNKRLQEKVIKLFIDSLIPLGYLGLGKKETLSLSEQASSFLNIDKEEKIYRRIKV